MSREEGNIRGEEREGDSKGRSCHHAIALRDNVSAFKYNASGMKVKGGRGWERERGGR